MAAWERVVTTTITDHIKQVVNNTLRNHKFLAKLQAMGRITYGHSGGGDSTNEDFDWRVQFQQAVLSGLDASDTLTFDPTQRYKVARLPYRGYSMQDMMTEKDRLQNRGGPAIINYFSQMGERLLEDAQEQISSEFYIDGNGTGNSKRFHGLESFMASAGGEGATTKYATPTDTYAGLDTTPGGVDGVWLEGTWPEGNGQPAYDFWSPKLLNWSANNWGTSSTTFDDNANVVLRRGIRHTQVNAGMKGQIDCVFLDRSRYMDFLDLNQTKEQINVNRGNKKTSLVALGFDDVTMFEGVEITSEFRVPANVGYGLNFNEVELRMLNENKQLFDVKGPTWDIERLAYLLAIICFGNMKFNPRAFFKMKNYA